MSDTAASHLDDWLREIRRDLHRIPEPGFEENLTSAYLRRQLDRLGIAHRTAAKTGIVAWLGRESGPAVALRADMDALPLPEKTNLPFASLHPGMMHACGHDGHMAMLLGAAALLRETALAGKVVLLFQPSEEKTGGARTMIEEGALDGVGMIFGGHLDRHFKPGEFGIEPGLICAYTDSFHITIRGKGGHAARPHETVDSIVVASLLVMSIQTLVSREVNPAYPTVVTVGRIEGGTAANVIAEHAVLEGTIRTTHPQMRQTIIVGLRRMVESMQVLYNATTTLAVTEGYPPIINDPLATDIARQAAVATAGAANVQGLPYPSMGGEDFSYYLQKVPGCFVRIGSLREDLATVPSHSPFYDFDEAALPGGARFFARVATLALAHLAGKPE
ncbi:MAG: M20 family metallopeptidase [Thermodesulfobacteriota bacterium]